MGRILLIDDDPGVREKTAEYLSLKGYEVVAQETGLAGLASLILAAFDLVILDLRLPGMGGEEVLDRIRKSTRADVPVIVHTGDFALLSKGVGKQATRVLTKPYDPEALVAVIEAVLRKEGEAHPVG